MRRLLQNALIVGIIAFFLFAGVMAFIQENQEKMNRQPAVVDSNDNGYVEAIVIQNLIKSGKLSLEW